MVSVDCGLTKCFAPCKLNGIEQHAGRRWQRRPYVLLTVVSMVTISTRYTSAASLRDEIKVSKWESPLASVSRELAVTTTTVTNIGQCYDDLLQADANNDAALTSDEFVDFINLQSDNRFQNVSSFANLPLTLVQLFNIQACDCATSTCCNNAANTTTTAPSINITSLANTTSFCSDVTATLASIAPTISPTFSPTKPSVTPSPTAAPTSPPTSTSPTMAPTNQTKRPTFTPSPAAPPSNTTNSTVSPTVTPNTNSPTAFNRLLTVPVAFIGCNVKNYTVEQITSRQNNDMLATIEEALQNKSSQVLMNDFRRKRRRSVLTASRNRLLVLALNNATIVNTTDVECAAVNYTGVITLSGSSCSSCLLMQSIVYLSLDDGEQPDVVQPLFEDKLSSAIKSEGLVYPGFQAVSMAITPSPAPAVVDTPPDGLSTAAVIGIACGAFAAGIVTIAGLYTNHKRQERRQKTFGPSPPPEDASEFVSSGPPLEQSKMNAGIPVTAGAAAGAAAIPIARKDSTHHSGSDGDVGSLAESDVSSSQAGSSGWSSSAGLSSLNTGSFDSADLESGTLTSATSPTNVHKSLTALLAAGGAATRLDDRHRNGPVQFAPLADSTVSVYKSEPGEAVLEEERFTKSGVRCNDSVSSFESSEMRIPTHSDLEAAIKAGDWAAVGATATILAGGSIGDSSNSNDDSTASGLGSANAKELDRLVDTADWEGVVLAASKFERPDIGSPSSFEDNVRTRSSADALFPSAVGSPGLSSLGKDSIDPSHAESLESVGSSSDDSSYDDSESESDEEATSVGLNSSVMSPATSSTTGISEVRLAEIRAEVEALVRRVVPDEINNIDEMMNQFKGREEELVETLRTMQERTIAKRERAARNKSAKLVAKREVRQKRKMQAAKAVGAQSTREGLPPNGLPPRAVGAAAGAAGAAIAVTVLREETPIARLRNRTPSPANLSSTSEFSEPNFKQEVQSPQSVDSISDWVPIVKPNKGDSKGAVVSGDIVHVAKKKAVRESMEKAIESGNWEAVGNAAALMADSNSTISAGTVELHEPDSSGYGSGSTGNASVDKKTGSQLDDMIQAGDWTGVVLAAKEVSKPDAKVATQAAPRPGKEEKSKSWRVRKMFGGFSSKSKAAYADTDSDGEDVAKSVTDKALQEEQDALAQAEIWMAIAAQSKQDGATEAKGASEAADWAIERSLSALQTADRSAADGGDEKGSVLPGAVKDDTSV